MDMNQEKTALDIAELKRDIQLLKARLNQEAGQRAATEESLSIRISNLTDFATQRRDQDACSLAASCFARSSICLIVRSPIAVGGVTQICVLVPVAFFLQGHEKTAIFRNDNAADAKWHE